ncbi:M15 family metallopeptidase [Streptomyces mangrovisoli]|uniref:Peptidase M15C domain-containing protein n=1 Tax=Streptomyces mangrovisoli TaxID=1428628 RepID=A0A1J4NMN5_9ACTN|nr:M15 family metallopeptidase [Streptomyces mangrovisoli]OIJ63681.1 hypothetical protein WN71_033245 [Streptomyces mangrovisoli]
MTTTRRVFLRAAAGVTLAAGAGITLASPAAAQQSVRNPTDPTGSHMAKVEAAAAKVQPGTRSPNGWLVNTAANQGGSVWTRPVAGTGFGVDVAIGPAETVLVHVIRRFHYEIDTLRPGDVVGFRTPGSVKHGDHEENHASGTAVDIRPGSYPRGVKGGFLAYEVAVIRDILAECEGVVRWGGDFTVPDESHFEIVTAPGDSRLRALDKKLRRWNSTPGQGAGVIRDPQDKKRLAAAEKVERRQS